MSKHSTTLGPIPIWKRYSAHGLDLSDWLLLLVLFAFAVRFLVRFFRHLLTSGSRQRRKDYLLSLAMKARTERDTKPSFNAFSVNTDGIDLSKCSISEVHKKILAHEITPEQVVAFAAKRCRKIGLDKINAVAEEKYDEALDVVRTLKFDPSFLTALAEDGESEGKEGEGDESFSSLFSPCSLLGIPISVKDQYNQVGCYSSCGCQARLEERKTSDSLLVRLVREAGALPLVRGNVPQLLMLPESTNNIYGTTLNPFNPNFCAGGSSGGDAALVGSGCVSLALGGDIGGSLRIPAHFNGICAFKPTAERVSRKGVMNPRLRDRNGQIFIKGTCGPMASCVDDCARLMDVWWRDGMFKEDPAIAPCPFMTDIYLEGNRRNPLHIEEGRETLRIGYFETDNFFEPCKTAKRALQETMDAMERQGGVEFVPFQFPTTSDGRTLLDGWALSKLYFRVMGSEGNMHNFKEGLEGEDFIDLYKSLYLYSNLPNFLRPAICQLLRLQGQVRPTIPIAATRNGGISARELQDALADLVELRRAYVQALHDQNLDALLFPGGALPAFKHGLSKELVVSLTYYWFGNLLHFPAGVVPVTHVRKDEENYYPDEELPTNQRDRFSAFCRESMEGSEGLPFSVQVMTRPYQDELCLHIMKKVEDAMKTE